MNEKPKAELNVDLAITLGLLRLRCPRCNGLLEWSYDTYYVCVGRGEECQYTSYQVDGDWLVIGWTK